MKTSILISSFAALCLLVTFAEAPRRHIADKLNTSSANPVAIVTEMKATMLAGVTVISPVKKESVTTLPVIPAEDFSYLKFDVAKYMESDVSFAEDAEELPEALETDFSYLKFDVNKYITESEMADEELPELVVSETSSIIPMPALNEFEYLKFDVKAWMNNNTAEEGFGELPVAENK